MGPDTERLLQAARGGDRDALDAVYARHRGRLVAFVASRIRPGQAGAATAEDIVQEVHLESARRIDAFAPEGPAAFYRWLVAIARFKIQEAVRSARTRKRSAEEPLAFDPVSRGTSPSGGAMRGERAAAIAGALESLPGEQGEAVRLRYLEGLTVAEAADRLGKSPAAVKALVSRGLGALAARLSPSSV